MLFLYKKPTFKLTLTRFFANTIVIESTNVSELCDSGPIKK